VVTLTLMATRLDRLVVLLETGSTALVRNTAAQQLADIQRQHPHELYNLLARVAPYLRNKEWECRVAAGRAIGGISENVPQWDPNTEDGMQDVEEEAVVKVEHSSRSAFTVLEEDDCRLSLGTFDPSQVLRYGQKLLGSAGKASPRSSR
jgi:TATA-binding protein-associated factor